jgi:leucyl-tRNA synthetase
LRITEYADRLLKDWSALNSRKHERNATNWIGKSSGAEIDFAIKGHEQLRVYTTARYHLCVDFMVIAPELKL